MTNPKIRLSSALGVESSVLDKKNVFDGFIGLDSELYVDPRLLKDTSIPELKNSYSNFINHFRGVVKLLAKTQTENDLLFNAAVKRLKFKEPNFLGLGYSEAGNSGSGIGGGLARQLASTAQQIIQAGIDDPELFELIGLFEEGIGADRISDMTSRLILRDLLSFSARVAAELSLQTKQIKVGTQVYELPTDIRNGSPIILLPKDILNNLPVANDRSDLQEVYDHNEKLRSEVNLLLGEEAFKDRPISRLSKRSIKDILLENQNLLST
jgi:hypothetical protein